MSKTFTRLAMAVAVFFLGAAVVAYAVEPKPASSFAVQVSEDNLATIVADLPTEDVYGAPIAVLTKVELYCNYELVRTFENVNTAAPFIYSMPIEYLPGGYVFGLVLYNGEYFTDMQESENVNGRCDPPVPATSLVATVKGTTVTLSCDLPKTDTNGKPMTTASRVMLFRDTYVKPFITLSDVSTATTFKYVDTDVPASSKPYKYAIVVYNGNQCTDMQYFPSVVIGGAQTQPAVPASPTDFEAEVVHSSVVITFTMPTTDANGNSLSWDDLSVMLKRVNPDGSTFTLDYVMASAATMSGQKYYFLDENLPDGEYRYMATLANNKGSAPVLAGDKNYVVAKVSDGDFSYPVVNDLDGHFEEGSLVLTWSEPAHDNALLINGYYIYANNTYYGYVRANETGKYAAMIDEPVASGMEFFVIVGYVDNGLDVYSQPSNAYRVTLSVDSVGLDSEECEYYSLQGIRIDKPASGVCIVRKGGKAFKALF